MATPLKFIIFTGETNKQQAMSFIDRILSLFSGSNNGTSTLERTTDERAIMDRSTTSAASSPYKIHTAIRIDGMSISNDFKDFYLIDAGKLITFPLDTPSGLIIGNLLGSLTFAAQIRTAKVATIDDDGTPESKFLKSATQPSFAAAAPSTDALTSAAETRFELELGDMPVWAPHILVDDGILAIIGMTDLGGVFKDVPSEDDLPKVLPLPLKDNLIKIFKRDRDILITSQKGRLVRQVAS